MEIIKRFSEKYGVRVQAQANFNTRVESLDKPNKTRLIESRRCVFPPLPL